jgi:hypothetical protein
LHSHEIGSSRFQVLNTLFGLPDTSLIVNVIDFFDNHPDYTRAADQLGVTTVSGARPRYPRRPAHAARIQGSTLLTYESIYTDIRIAVDAVHDKVPSRRWQGTPLRSFFWGFIRQPISPWAPGLPQNRHLQRSATLCASGCPPSPLPAPVSLAGPAGAPRLGESHL